jgi:multidrug efflux pump subunit AcrA (membrane-fusion protein)
MKRKTFKTIGWVVAIAIIIISGILVIKKAKQRDTDAPVAKVYPVSVATVKTVLEQVTLTLPYLAQVQNDQDVTLTSKVAARIQFLKPSGSTVNKGEVIARLDNSTFQTSLQSVQSQMAAQKTALNNLVATHKRTLELLAVKGASREQSEGEETRIADTESRIEALNQNKNELGNSFTYTTITAPISGIISKTMANTGDVSMPGQPIAFISSMNGSYLKLSVPANLKIYGITRNNQLYKAISLNSTFNSLAEYKVYINNLNLMSGERVPLDVVVYDGKAIKIPFDAILNRNGRSYVFVKENDKAIAKEINIIQTGENGVVISNDDLAGKDIVIAKQDILLNLLSGVSIQLKKD